MTEIKDKEKIPLNHYTVKTINGTRYKDFKQLFEDIVVTKAAQQQNEHCDAKENAL